MSTDSIWEQKHDPSRINLTDEQWRDIESKLKKFTDTVTYKRGVALYEGMSAPLMGTRPSIMELMEYRNKLMKETHPTDVIRGTFGNKQEVETLFFHRNPNGRIDPKRMVSITKS